MTPESLKSIKSPNSLSSNTTLDSVLVVSNCNMRHFPVIVTVYIQRANNKTHSPQYVECLEAISGFDLQTNFSLVNNNTSIIIYMKI